MKHHFIPALAGFGPVDRPARSPFRGLGATLHSDASGPEPDGGGGGHRHGHRGRRGPGRRGGFGPGFGAGFGSGFGPGGPMDRPRGRRGGRRQRGNVRAAVLALLAEEPRHGYAIMNELAERSGGLWRPSPGSVYPVLSQLQDEGLVTVTDAQGRRVFSLTDAGREHVAANADELREPWAFADAGPLERVHRLMASMAGLGAAVEQVARLGDDAQVTRVEQALDEARRTAYRVLAGDDPEPGSTRRADDEGPSSTPPA